MTEEGAGKEQQFTAAEALRLVSGYFDTEWPATDLEDVELQKVTGGFVNRLHILKRTNANSTNREPSSVLIRHFGRGEKKSHEEPLASNTTLSATDQAVIYYEMGRRGWGPLLYGAFPGGRLEEYLDAHPLTAAESCEPSIRRDLARSYARLHSLQLPFKRRNFGLVVDDLKAAILKRRDSSVRKLRASADPESLELASQLENNAWDQELEWASNLFERHQCKATLAVGDANYLNVMVKNYESECRTVLIDYETCTYSYRGIDIGGHFNERMYCWSNPETNMTGYDAPARDEQRLFCQSYLEEMRALGQSIDSMDTEEHLLLEARIGQMWQLLFSVMMGFVADDLPNDPVLHAGLAHMLNYYCRLKQEWLA
ncbi:hypothetical protein M409DRAFT_66654 [Zasmidium cellare ATCC 36951]|uniref:Aminoglycoside phosphotransferase domain-containing protein n=1 Tax=Zasmidium cellare ATCC 36951 TaxID=1080233 RepID=A0A6A6CHL1_ZASCE|nr:uncharacterized protein M409DRAFT_66654 [Zasmidium cellare ATCC 36951]KAF2166684.1 hypothetical protein M409DRAFT_66654 [Zasmidium cellare ATCC 36951]